MSIDEKNTREHTAEEVAEGVKPTFIGIDGVSKAYNRYINKEELEK